MITDRSWKASQNWDGLGAGASALCFVHCVLGPVIFVVSPALAHLIPGDEAVHRVLAIAILGFAVLAIHSGYRIHRRKRVLIVIASGLVAITVAAVAGDRMGSHAIEVFITVLGSALLIYGHGLNRYFCRQCGRCNEQQDFAAHLLRYAGIVRSNLPFVPRPKSFWTRYKSRKNSTKVFVAEIPRLIILALLMLAACLFGMYLGLVSSGDHHH